MHPCKTFETGLGIVQGQLAMSAPRELSLEEQIAAGFSGRVPH